MAKGIPFSLTLHKAPTTVDEMSKDEFDSMMAKGLAQAKANESRPASDVLSDIRNNLNHIITITISQKKLTRPFYIMKNAKTMPCLA